MWACGRSVRARLDNAVAPNGLKSVRTRSLERFLPLHGHPQPLHFSFVITQYREDGDGGIGPASVVSIVTGAACHPEAGGLGDGRRPWAGRARGYQPRGQRRQGESPRSHFLRLLFLCRSTGPEREYSSRLEQVEKFPPQCIPPRETRGKVSLGTRDGTAGRSAPGIVVKE